MSSLMIEFKTLVAKDDYLTALAARMVDSGYSKTFTGDYIRGLYSTDSLTVYVDGSDWSDRAADVASECWGTTVTAYEVR